MSDSKKRDRALQRLVRARQAKTGESYQAALQQLTEDHALPQERLYRRVPSSLSAGVKVLPGELVHITAAPQLDSFWPDRLLIKNADRWDLRQLTVENGLAANGDGHSLIEETGSRSAVFSPDTWHPLISHKVRCGQTIAVTATYTGPQEQGECFEATLFGWEGRSPAKAPAQHATPVSERVTARATSKIVRPNETIKLPLTVTVPALFVDQLTIANAKDWTINDILVRGKSILVQSGDLPGEMFSGSAPVILEPLAADDCVEVVATYTRRAPVDITTSRLMVELAGTTKPLPIPNAPSHFLPMSSGVPVPPAQSVQITSRPQCDFLPERLVISNSDDWTVNDLIIGIRCQVAARGDLPGQTFASRSVGSHMILDPVHMGQEFVMVTTRDVNCKEEANFVCGVQGRRLEQARH